jgi:hypothetical protein
VLQRLIDPKRFDDGFFTKVLLRFFARLAPENVEATG